MFAESFFKDLDQMVDKYVEASDEVDYVTVIVRTRLGSFSVARAHAGEMLVRLRVHPPPQGDDDKEAETSSSDTEAGVAHVPATDFDTLPLAYIPYAEIVLIEIMPMIGERGYVPSREAAPDPVIGFGR